MMNGHSMQERRARLMRFGLLSALLGVLAGVPFGLQNAQVAIFLFLIPVVIFPVATGFRWLLLERRESTSIALSVVVGILTVVVSHLIFIFMLVAVATKGSDVTLAESGTLALVTLILFGWFSIPLGGLVAAIFQYIANSHKRKIG